METPKTVGEDPFHKHFGMWWRPHQDFVYISRRFYSHWESVIAGHEVLAADPNGNTTQFTIGVKHGRPAFTNGLQQFADFYSLNTRTLLHFKYIEPLTFHFRIFPNGGPEIEYPQNENAPEVIHIDSDSDSDSEDDDFDRENNWQKDVTKRIAEGRNPLHVPARVAGRLIHTGRATINVRVLNKNAAADCEIRPSQRNKNEAYLCDGWYGLCKELQMTPGSTMFFTYFPTEVQLVMSVVRNN